jgi:hypothetical protein
MKYLYDNGFKVLTINQLGYDTASNILCIKGGAPISNNYSLSSKTASKIVIAPLPHPTTTTTTADCHTFISCL